MKRLGQCLLAGVFAALLILSCRTLVTRPEAEVETAPLPPPVQAALTAASEAASAEDMLAHEQPGTSSRRLLSGVTDAAELPARIPVRDGNGTPLGHRPYVRTVYTACRLEGTSG